MKNLYQFQKFLLPEFLNGKELTVTGCHPWKDYDTEQILGTAVDIAITKDETLYQPSKDGSVQTNLFEKFTVKLQKFNFSVPAGTVVTIVNGTANVYGERRNQLSVKAEDVKIVQAPGGKEG